MKKLLIGLTFLTSISSYADCSSSARKDIIENHSSLYADAHITEIKRIDERVGLYLDGRAGNGYVPKYEVYKSSVTDEGGTGLYLAIYDKSTDCKLYDLIKLD